MINIMGLRKIILGALLTGLLSCPAFAQQADDQVYKDMLQAQHFILTYQEEGSPNLTRIVADGDTRLVRKSTNVKNGMVWSSKAMYRDGKLYSFFVDRGETKARVLALTDINREDLDPKEEWPKTYRMMALPKGLSVLAWGDSWRNNPISLTEPVFNNETKVLINGVEYTCNQYSSNILTQQGSTSGVITYNLLYKDGKLAKIQRYLQYDGREKMLDTLNIIELKKDYDVFELAPWGQPINVYKADAADLNDLMNNYVQVEVLGENKNDKK